MTGTAADTDWFGLAVRWVHFLAGITWIGLLYFFNLINAAFLKSLDGPTK
ncbi:MAG: urate hydroxylase PuuD, partial [Nitrospirota bacterium]|nr:urate hydroxylase PuuD [Nitrospirota bacterium]